MKKNPIDNPQQAYQITSVVLAAGVSRRMGEPKLVLPWGETTVIRRVVSVLREAGAGDILVVTGGACQAVEEALESSGTSFVHNPEYQNGEMLGSIQVGLRAAGPQAQAALIVLGDQPQILPHTVRRVLEAAREAPDRIIVPSFQNHRGHPWVLPRESWPEVLHLSSPQTMRDYLNDHANQITYLQVDTPSVLKDLDTPEDYRREKPAA